MLLESPAIVLIPPQGPEERRPGREVWSVIIEEYAPGETDHTRPGAHAIGLQPDGDDPAVGQIRRQRARLKSWMRNGEVVVPGAECGQEIAARICYAGPIAIRRIFRGDEGATQRASLWILHVKGNQW